MSHCTILERSIAWSPEGRKQVTLRSHEIALSEVSSAQTLWGGYVLYLPDRLVVLFSNGTAHIGHVRSQHGTRTFHCDILGRVEDPAPILELARKLWPHATPADEHVFYQEPREINRNPVCKYRT